MGRAQPKTLTEYERLISGTQETHEEPARPINFVQGEVAAMQGLIASRMASGHSVSSSPNTADYLEAAVAAVSRFSGYALMAATGFGLGMLIFF